MSFSSRSRPNVRPGARAKSRPSVHPGSPHAKQLPPSGVSKVSTDLFIRNPHSIIAALNSRPKDVLEVTLPREKTDGVWDKIENLANKNKVQLRDAQAKPQVNDARFMGRESGHGALIRPKQPISIERLFDDVDESTRGTWIALDTLQDPQNLGAIFRAAAFF